MENIFNLRFTYHIINIRTELTRLNSGGIFHFDIDFAHNGASLSQRNPLSKTSLFVQLSKGDLGTSEVIVVAESVVILDLDLGKFLSLAFESDGFTSPSRVSAFTLGNGALSSVPADLELAVGIHLSNQVLVLVEFTFNWSEGNCSLGSMSQTSCSTSSSASSSSLGKDGVSTVSVTMHVSESCGSSSSNKTSAGVERLVHESLAGEVGVSQKTSAHAACAHAACAHADCVHASCAKAGCAHAACVDSTVTNSVGDGLISEVSSVGIVGLHFLL